MSCPIVATEMMAVAEPVGIIVTSTRGWFFSSAKTSPLWLTVTKIDKTFHHNWWHTLSRLNLCLHQQVTKTFLTTPIFPTAPVMIIAGVFHAPTDNLQCLVTCCVAKNVVHSAVSITFPFIVFAMPMRRLWLMWGVLFWGAGSLWISYDLWCGSPAKSGTHQHEI